MAGVEEQLRQLESQFTDSEEEQEGEQEEEELDLGGLEELYCVACDRLCKSMAAKENHETSKKHKENMEKLILEMQGEEDEQEDEDETESVDEEEEDGAEEEPEEIRCSPCGEIFKTEEAKAKHEASKKHRKNLKLNDKKKSVKEKEDVLGKVMDNDEKEKAGKKKVKGKNKKKKLNDETPEENEVCAPTTTETHDSEDKQENVDNLDNGDEESVQPEVDSPLQKKVQVGKQVKCPPDNDEGDEPVKSSCAQCGVSFPSKTKLHNHLKTTGHAVSLGAAEGGKKKKKSRK